MAEPKPAQSLALAKGHLDRAQSAAIDPTDWTDLSTYGFYCLEAAVMAASGHLKLKTERSHRGKAEAAALLAAKFNLPDVSGLLVELNTARKSHAYGDVDAPELDAETISIELEEFVDAVTKLLGK